MALGPRAGEDDEADRREIADVDQINPSRWKSRKALIMDLERLYFLLDLHERLLKYPKLKIARAEVETLLSSFEPRPVPAVAPAPVYPSGSGVTETDTNSVPTPADRRA